MHLKTRQRPPPPSSTPGLPEFQKRQSDWSSTPSIAERFPGAGRFALDFCLRDPSGLRTPSPFRQTYEPQMRAFFDLRCPLHDCRDGGFPLGKAVSHMLDEPRAGRTGTAVCTGERVRKGGRDACGLEMSWTLVALED